jgi:hypothetical protein
MKVAQEKQNLQRQQGGYGTEHDSQAELYWNANICTKSKRLIIFLSGSFKFFRRQFKHWLDTSAEQVPKNALGQDIHYNLLYGQSLAGDIENSGFNSDNNRWQRVAKQFVIGR